MCDPEDVVEIIYNVTGRHRVVIHSRPDGGFGYRGTPVLWVSRVGL